MCGPKGYGVLVSDKVCFLYSSQSDLELGMFLEVATFHRYQSHYQQFLHKAFNIGLN